MWFAVVWFVVALWFLVAVVSGCGGCGCPVVVVVVALWLRAVVVELWLHSDCTVVATALWLEARSGCTLVADFCGCSRVAQLVPVGISW